MPRAPARSQGDRGPRHRLPRAAASLACLVALATGPAGAFAHGDLDQATAALTARIVSAGRTTAAERAALLVERAELYRLARDLERASRDLARAAALDPTSAGLDLVTGKVELDAGRADAGLAAFERHLAKRPDDPRALAGAADALVRLGRPTQAALRLDRACAARPEPDLYVTRANVLAALGPDHLDRAIAGLDEGLGRLGPVVGLNERALELELELGRYDAALARIDRILEATGRPDLWLARRADVLDRAGRPTDAQTDRRRALAAQGRLAPALRARPETRELARTLHQRLGTAPR